MKGWILVEKNKPIVNSNGSVEVFKTKIELLDYYGGAIGDLNSVKRVELIICEGFKIFKYKISKSRKWQI
jgi:hypothetical protein